MKCLESIPSPTRLNYQSASAFILFTFLIGSASVLGSEGIRVEGPGRISLPSLVVSASPQQVYSGSLTLDLTNKDERNGWLLTGAITENALVGTFSEERIPANLTFQSITWVSGGNGSAAGITLYPDGKRIEADPGFGIGKYLIQFEVRYDVPAFPVSDSYNCVSTFIVQ